MFATISEYIKKSKKRNNNVVYDNENRAIIDLCVRDDDSFLSPYSTDTKSVISGEVAEFINHSVNSLHPNEQIHLRIHSNCIDDKEKVEYSAAIKSYYSDCLNSSIFETLRLKSIAIIMAVIGVIALALMIWLDLNNFVNPVIIEVIDIFAWVFLWEAVDVYFLERTNHKFKQKRFTALKNSVIEYLPLK